MSYDEVIRMLIDVFGPNARLYANLFPRAGRNDIKTIEMYWRRAMRRYNVETMKPARGCDSRPLDHEFAARINGWRATQKLLRSTSSIPGKRQSP